MDKYVRVRCTYCERHIAMGPRKRLLLKHRDRRGFVCRASRTNAFALLPITFACREDGGR